MKATLLFTVFIPTLNKEIEYLETVPIHIYTERQKHSSTMITKSP
jgi:hypothetical protein